MTVGTDQRALDELCVNTIRTLSMDAVQKANSGHPGTPMALAPIAYLLYTRIMKHAPEDPHWLGPRPLRALLRARVDAALLDALPGRLRRHARPDQALPPARLAVPPGHPEYGHVPGVETTTGPLGPGHLDRGRHGARRAHAGRPLQPRRPRPDRPPHLLHRLRRRHGGGHLLRGVLDRRPPRARQADRLLRRQPHLDRGRHQARRSPRTSARATRPTAGTSRTCTRTSRSTALEAALRSRARRRPTARA